MKYALIFVVLTGVGCSRQASLSGEGDSVWGAWSELNECVAQTFEDWGVVLDGFTGGTGQGKDGYVFHTAGWRLAKRLEPEDLLPALKRRITAKLESLGIDAGKGFSLTGADVWKTGKDSAADSGGFAILYESGGYHGFITVRMIAYSPKVPKGEHGWIYLTVASQ